MHFRSPWNYSLLLLQRCLDTVGTEFPGNPEYHREWSLKRQGCGSHMLEFNCFSGGVIYERGWPPKLNGYVPCCIYYSKKYGIIMERIIWSWLIVFCLVCVHSFLVFVYEFYAWIQKWKKVSFSQHENVRLKLKGRSWRFNVEEEDDKHVFKQT